MQPPRRPAVVAGYEGRPQSVSAVLFASVLARAWGARLLAAWVPEQQGAYSSATREWQWSLREETHRLETAARQVLGPDDEWELYPCPALTPARGLHDLALEEAARAIVVGSSHLGRLGGVAIGSTAGRLLVRSPCPVAVAPAGWARSDWAAPLTVGVGLDGCRDCDAALAEARLLADGLGARLVALAVAPHADLTRARRRRACADAAARVDAQLDRGGGSGGERLVLGGSAATALAMASRDLSLLVVGCRTGAGVVGHPTVRSVSRRLTRTAACPLLVVPEGLAVAPGLAAARG